jgi:hypothetical protein
MQIKLYAYHLFLELISIFDFISWYLRFMIWKILQRVESKWCLPSVYERKHLSTWLRQAQIIALFLLLGLFIVYVIH